MLYFRLSDGVLFGCAEHHKIDAAGNLIDTRDGEVIRRGQKIKVADCGSASTDLDDFPSTVCCCDGDCHGGSIEVVSRVAVARIKPITRVLGFRVVS